MITTDNSRVNENLLKENDKLRLEIEELKKKLNKDEVSKSFYCKCKEPVMIYKKNEQPSCSDCGGLEQ